jgi:hypothetical protein
MKTEERSIFHYNFFFKNESSILQYRVLFKFDIRNSKKLCSGNNFPQGSGSGRDPDPYYVFISKIQ